MGGQEPVISGLTTAIIVMVTIGTLLLVQFTASPGPPSRDLAVTSIKARSFSSPRLQAHV